MMTWSQVNLSIISSSVLKNPTLFPLALKVDEWHSCLCLIFFHELVEECAKIGLDFNPRVVTRVIGAKFN